MRVVNAFVEALDLGSLGLHAVNHAASGRRAYHPDTPLKIYIYGYPNRIQSSHRLEREAQQNLELIWLTGRHPTSRTLPTSARTTAPQSRPRAVDQMIDAMLQASAGG